MNFFPGTSRRRRRAVALLAAMAAAGAAGCAAREASLPPGAHVVVFAVEGLEPRLLQRGIEAGELPTLERLIRHGSALLVEPPETLTAPAIWTTIATGVSPEVHGITGYQIGGVPAAPELRRAPAFWDLLAARGVETATIAWPVTWPAEKGAGIMLSDRATWPTHPSRQEPAGYLDLDAFLAGLPSREDVLARFTELAGSPPATVAAASSTGAGTFGALLEQRLVAPFRSDRARCDMALEVMRRSQPRVLAVTFSGIDHVSHAFWKEFEPAPFERAGWRIDPGERAACARTIPLYYQFVDGLVGEVLAAAPRDAVVFLLSGHGFGPGLGPYAVDPEGPLSGNHRPDPILLVSGRGALPGAGTRRPAIHEDFLPTLFYVLGEPAPADAPGRALAELFAGGEEQRRLNDVSLEPGLVP